MLPLARFKARTPKIRLLICVISSALGITAALPASSQPSWTGATNTASTATLLSRRFPSWFEANYLSSLKAPLQEAPLPVPPAPVVQQFEPFPDASGTFALYQPLGSTPTATNAFFQPLGTNGRACVTCHVPASSMGLSVANAQTRFKVSGGRDPLFAPVDGATCPSNVQAARMATSLPYYLLLNKGLFRIPLAVPAGAEYTLTVVSDPWGCNTDPRYNQVTNPITGITSQIVSVYRRPPMAANLNFKVITAANTGGFAAVDPLDFSIPLLSDPATGLLENGNIMWDGREATLESQAVDATLSHAQAQQAPTAVQVAQIVAFETGIYGAQVSDRVAGDLTRNGPLGGPINLSAAQPGLFATSGAEVVSAFDAWNPTATAESARRASIYRGEQIFNSRAFSVTNVAGFNNAAFVGNLSPQEHCSTCHGQIGGTTDPLPMAQHAIGIGGDQPLFGGPRPATDLPMFRLACKSGVQTPFNGSVVTTNDPGRALITGKCADVGRMTVPQLRGLAARAPYFSDGSAAGLLEMVAFYNRRFQIGLTAQDQADLVAFLNSL